MAKALPTMVDQIMARRAATGGYGGGMKMSTGVGTGGALGAMKPARPKKRRAAKKPKLRTIGPSKPGQKPITFRPGALHAQLGVPQGQKIPAKKKAAALAGRYGPLAEKRAQFAKNVLTGPKG